jgi:molybdopterin converting factor small subunit
VGRSEIVTVLVRYFAAARAAAGTAEEKISVPADAGVGAVLAAARQTHGPELARILDRCSFLLDQVAVHDAAAPLVTDRTLDVLPPFAGG